jgi:hypothetical protein
MPTALIVEMIQAILALAPQVPEVIALGQSAVNIVKAGTVSPADEAAIRTQLDQVKALIDAA